MLVGRVGTGRQLTPLMSCMPPAASRPRAGWSALVSRFCILLVLLAATSPRAEEPDQKPEADVAQPVTLRHDQETDIAGDIGVNDAAGPGLGEGAAKATRDSGSLADIEAVALVVEGSMPNTLAYSPILIFDFEPGEDLAAVMPRFMVRYSSHFPDGATPQLLHYGMAARPEIGVAVGVTSVFAAGEWLGFFLTSGSGSECDWISDEKAYVAVDPFGQHPMLTSDGSQWAASITADFANSDGRSHDWSAVPARGEAFFRQWRSQEHLNEVPHRDGLVFRYEGGNQYQPRAQRGRGNSAHHWNLLAYGLERVSTPTRLGRCFSNAVDSIFTSDWLERYGGKYDAEWAASAMEAAMVREGKTNNQGGSGG